MLTFVNDFFHKVWAYFMRQKNEVFPTFKKFKALVKNRIGRMITNLKNDSMSSKLLMTLLGARHLLESSNIMELQNLST